MSVALNCEVSDDSHFVIRAMRSLAADLGMVAENAKFSDFTPSLQSRILQDAQLLKKTYNQNRR